MIVSIPPDTISRWGCFTRVPEQILTLFPEGADLPPLEIEVSQIEDTIQASSDESLIAAIQVAVGKDPKKSLIPEWEGQTFFFDNKPFRLNYVHDSQEHEYGWYIIEVGPS